MPLPTLAGPRPSTLPWLRCVVVAWLVVLAGVSCSLSREAQPATPSGSSAGQLPSATSPRVPGTGSNGSGPNGSTAPGNGGEPAVPTLRWQSCGRGVECATATVPLDHGQPSGPTIDLAVVRRPATNTAQRLGSLFINPGGPGASGVDFAKSAGDLGGLGRRFDIVSWDPRGVGQSTPVVCTSDVQPYRSLDWGPDDADEQRQLDDGARRIAESCASSARDLLGHVGTDDTARDLDQLRRAVGDAGLTYLGFSYGTLIGQRYAELFPTRVRAMVLDGVVDPTEDLAKLLEGQTQALEQQVNAQFKLCEVRACPVSNPAAVYDQIAAAIESQPLSAGRNRLGPTDLAYAGISASYTPSSQTQFLQGLGQAQRGDGSTLLDIADAYFESGGYTSYLAVLCTDNPHPQGTAAFTALADRLHAISPRFGAAIANEVRPCAHWPAPVTGRPGPIRAAGSAPILVVGNTGDVATPYAAAQKVASTLERGVLLTYQGEGHTSFGKSRCVDAAIETYLVATTTPAAGAVCN